MSLSKFQFSSLLTAPMHINNEDFLQKMIEEKNEIKKKKRKVA